MSTHTTIKNAVPAYMRGAFAANGVGVDDLILAIHTDMTPEGDFADAYVGVDRNNLYILYGEERVVKTQGARRIVSEYETRELVTYPLKHLGVLSTQTLLSTCRLISDPEGKEEPEEEEKGKQASGKEKLVLLFSLGCQGFVDRLLKVIRNINKGEDPLKEIKEQEELFCLECGTRFPEPDRKLCPKCTDKMSIFVRLMGFFKFYKKKVATVSVTMLLVTALSILAPYVSTRLLIDEVLTPPIRHYESAATGGIVRDYDRVAGGDYIYVETLGGGWYEMVGLIVLAIMAMRFVTTAFNMLYQYVLGRTMPWMIYDLQMRIFEAMQRLSVSFYTSKRTGALMNRVSRDARNIYWFFVDGLPFIVINIAMFAGIFGMMFWMHWQLALICITIVPFAAGMFRLLRRIFRRIWHKQWTINSHMNNMVSDAVNGQRVIKAFAREGEESRRFTDMGNKHAAVDIAGANLAWTAFPMIYLFMFIGQVVVTALGGMMVIRGEISLGVLMAFLMYLGMLYGPLEFLSTVSNWWARCVDSAQRVFEVVDAKAEIEEPAQPVILESIRGEIVLDDVWFQYDPATPVLKGMNLTVPAGKTLGIVGKTGAGKSTMANLIARLYDTTEGTVKVDGVNVRDMSLSQLRASIGIVSQDIYLFMGSIVENIRYARPEATMEEVVWAAKMASAHDFIVALPDAYETRVGAGGQELSGGEKQRLSIARTIIQNPKILILDEATAAMDTETEGKIQTALNQLQSGRTTIAIAHRFSTLKDAENLAVIKDGVVVETGTHETLMRKKGEYHKLYSIQMEGLKVISME
ncbi:MAG: ABC transporter ATP-binding protein/permease [Defluviitaleaceae bacterium]|nr:ABC transporter ATP-binding protein/permease [Defluviitaleaceae bacterium]MCL2238421.1 ABC transporter ATP-binding protein/permease [Defluviitaleaceae bacterium]